MEKCLQCGNEAKVSGTIEGLNLLECADGHRTAQLTKQMVKAINDKLGVGTTDEMIVKIKRARKQVKQPIEKAA